MPGSSVLRKARRLERRGRYPDAIQLLTEAAERSADPTVLERLARIRREAYSAIPREGGPAEWPPTYDDCFEESSMPVEIDAKQLDAATLGAGITHHGCILVRKLLTSERAADLADIFEQTFRAADQPNGQDQGWYAPAPGESTDTNIPAFREWVRHTGGIWLGDAPRALFEILQAFHEVALPEVLTEYFGERPVFSLEKSTLRLATPEATTEWHQDGAFMGPGLRTVNVWIALTACGGEADVPGLDVWPHRLDDFLETGTRGARLDKFVGPEVVEELAAETEFPVVRPRFEPGDALIFDDHSLHATGVSPDMTGNRKAIEFWCFAPSTVPERYKPMVF